MESGTVSVSPYSVGLATLRNGPEISSRFERRKRVVFVIPAQAGIQRITPRISKKLGARLRGHDVVGNRQSNSDLFLIERNLLLLSQVFRATTERFRASARIGIKGHALAVLSYRRTSRRQSNGQGVVEKYEDCVWFTGCRPGTACHSPFARCWVTRKRYRKHYSIPLRTR